MKTIICLTFDIDWAPDEVIKHCIDIINNYNINATIFATHKTEVLNDLGNNIEIGLHPNFLNIDNAKNEIKKIKKKIRLRLKYGQ